MPLGPMPTGLVYHPVPDEHLPWGVDTPHNLVPMPLNPTAKADGPVHPQRMINKNQWHGNPLDIFRSRAALQGSAPVTQ